MNHDDLLDTQNPNDEREERLGRIIAEYSDRLNAGEAFDVEAALGAHPDLADDLAMAFSGLGQVVSTKKNGEVLGTLGDYTLRRQIGRGGMGVVYEAWENSMDRQVALKVLPPGVAADDRAVTRFVREARLAGKLNHPNVVGVYGMGVKEQTPYYAMELVEGETLAQLLARIKEVEPGTDTPFGKKDDGRYFINLAEAFADVADGLQHAHSKGVIHRDIKPSNLILDAEDRLRILDFGLARLEGQESLTLSGDIVGTPAYMSPEQAKRRKIPLDHRTDVYSLGATMYEALTGGPPFRGKNHADTLSHIIEQDPRPPRQWNPRAPQNFETIVLKCLRKDPSDRYGTAEALAQDLRRFLRGDPIEAQPRPAWEKLARVIWMRRLRIGAAIACALLVLAAALLATQYLRRVHDERLQTYRRMVTTAVSKLPLGQTIGQFGSTVVKRRHALNDLLLGDFVFSANFTSTQSIQRALDEFEAAADFLPEEPEAYYFRSRGFLALGEQEKALRVLEKALGRRDFLPARTLKAVIHSTRGEQKLAKAELARAREATMGDLADPWYRAQTAAASGEWEEAEAAFGKLIDALQDRTEEEHLGMHAEIRTGRGVARVELGEYDVALRDFHAAHLDWPTALAPGLLLGYCYLVKGTPDNTKIAEVWFKEFSDQVARRDRGLREEAILGIATMFSEWGDFNRAFAWLESLEDRELRVRAQLFCLLSDLILEDRTALGKALAMADAMAEKLSEDEVRDPMTMALIGYAWSHALGRASRTRELLEQATDLGPDDPRVHNIASRSYFNLNDWPAAIEHGREALRLAPSSLSATDSLGLALYWVGQRREALEVYLDRLESHSSSALLQLRLGMVYTRLDEDLSAEHHLESALRLCEDLSPESWECAMAYENFGRLEMRRGNLDAAESHYRRSIDASPRLPNNYYWMAQLRKKQKRWDEALQLHCDGLLLEYALNFVAGQLSQLSAFLQTNAHEISERDCLDQLVEFLEDFIEDEEVPAAVYAGFSVILVHAPRSKPERAFSYAMKAVELSSRKDPDHLTALAVAMRAVGRGSEAVAVLEEAVKLPKAKERHHSLLETYRAQVGGQ